MKTLLLLRHAKSDWGDAGQADIDRSLNERGERDALRLGEWMMQQHIQPEWIVCSPAERARQTLDGLRQSLIIPDTLIQFEERLYLASLTTLLHTLGRCPDDMDHILLLGHNPGMEDLLGYLCGQDLPRTASGKLLTTATLAQISLPDDLQQLGLECGKLNRIVRPGDLD